MLRGLAEKDRSRPFELTDVKAMTYGSKVRGATGTEENILKEKERATEQRMILDISSRTD